MKFKTLGNRNAPAVLFFHAMGVTGAVSYTHLYLDAHRISLVMELYNNKFVSCYRNTKFHILSLIHI